MLEDSLKVGNIRLPISKEAKLELVPHGFADTDYSSNPAEIVRVIRWLMQKSLLKQDTFLIGVPGYLRSHIALQFLELSNKEFEYLSITRDTTESDIKQRREIRDGTAFYSDSSAVKAAINGRVLLIDGVEKAERNVLPILNNLLENREMQLEDGRFLMAAARYDKLRKEYSEEQLSEWRLARVSENFSVLSLGLPTPPFTGHTLDPPLRSRFQCRNIGPLPFETMMVLCTSAAPRVHPERMRGLLGLVYGLNSQQPHKSGLFGVEGDLAGKKASSASHLVEEVIAGEMPLFPLDNLLKAAKVWDTNPTGYNQADIFQMCYPAGALPKESQQGIVRDFLQRFSIEQPASKQSKSKAEESSYSKQEPAADAKSPNDIPFISTPSLESHLATMSSIASTSVDFCLLGARGCGKTSLLRELAKRMGYASNEVETMVLYQDMNARELLQQRRMLPSGDTVWEDSQLVRAAKRGALCLLDGVERVHWSVLEALAPLIHHRFLQLPDGSRLVSQGSHAFLKDRLGLSDAELAEQKHIFPISERFRLVALGDPSPSTSSTGSALSGHSPKSWLNDQLLALFLFHTLQPMVMEEELVIVRGRLPEVEDAVATSLLRFVHSLRDSQDHALRSIAANSLSLRRVLFLLKCHANNSATATSAPETLTDAIRRATLARFMPTIVREAFEAKMRDAGLRSSPARSSSGTTHTTPATQSVFTALSEKIKKRKVSTESTTAPSEENGSPADFSSAAKSSSIRKELMVPEILYYENEEHDRVLAEMAASFQLGYHLLLIGNQGVGKNKVADRFLQTTNKARKYIQLHRDTTVQSLTVQTSVEEGILKYSNSPLVQAIRDGYVLVIDEADKAPLHVIAILKSLLDSSSFYLGDGRRILPAANGSECTPASASERTNAQVAEVGGGDIVTHPNFRLILLANRPGFPFAGNDLFSALGDLFSVHIVDNPSRTSEVQMLKRYGPNVDSKVVEKLAGLFADLRAASDAGHLPYPYSTRELVSVVRHMQGFPEDALEDVLANVFDFDSYTADAAEAVAEIFQKHRIPVAWGRGSWKKVNTTAHGEERLEIERSESDFDLSKLGDPKVGRFDPENTPHMGGNTWAGGTGGYDTAGLGGVGGPFRLDAGHPVHQMPESAKRQVPPEVLAKARQVAQEEYAKRLREIDMSTYDAKAYEELYAKVAKQVKQLRSVVESLEAREHERQWVRHQTSGDFDDSKLIEGVTGERTVYRRRLEAPPADPSHSQQAKPKRLRLCFDVSGSMYRFNGMDGRLQRSMESALLVMEAFNGLGEKVAYEIVGHSGDGPDIPFVKLGEEPANEKQHFDVLKRMLLHTQFCWSGDHTLEAVKLAGEELLSSADAYDESIAVVLSDANLDRYGITPTHLTRAMSKNEAEGVETFLVLIGSLGEQAQRLQKALPPGKAFVAKSAQELPEILQKIFASTVCK